MRDLDMEALEAAARAIWSVSFENARDDNAWEAIAEDTRAGVREEARRAIAAYLSAREAKGWREMPREPSDIMEAAPLDADFDIYWSYAADGRPGGPNDVWRAMFDAAAGGGDAT